MSNSQLKELKSGIKNDAEVTLNLWSNVIGVSKNGANFPHKLLLTDTQALRICKVFANGSSDNVKFSKNPVRILAELFAAIPQVMFRTGVKAIKKQHHA